ncbi:MAG: hypothetical protein Q7S68_03095 [Deltaproteobacteria bacterium]|nr:hypothetical protein [Deltaproteobacteria bacterium]
MTTEKQTNEKKPPSIWLNIFVLVGLCAAIIVSKEYSKRVLSGTLPAEEFENQIVLENLDEEAPLAESEPLQVPTVEKTAEKQTPPVEKKPAVKKPAVEQAKPATPTQATTVAQKDPYTDGGTRDLDRLENRPNYFPNEKLEVSVTRTQKSLATATKVLPTSTTLRDRFIPFEGE